MDSFIPVYYRMQKFLRDQIGNGALKPGDVVPPIQVSASEE